MCRGARRLHTRLRRCAWDLGAWCSRPGTSSVGLEKSAGAHVAAWMVHPRPLHGRPVAFRSRPRDPNPATTSAASQRSAPRSPTPRRTHARTHCPPRRSTWPVVASACRAQSGLTHRAAHSSSPHPPLLYSRETSQTLTLLEVTGGAERVGQLAGDLDLLGVLGVGARVDGLGGELVNVCSGVSTVFLLSHGRVAERHATSLITH